jgi:hypothetical protein
MRRTCRVLLLGLGALLSCQSRSGNNTGGRGLGSATSRSATVVIPSARAAGSVVAPAILPSVSARRTPLPRLAYEHATPTPGQPASFVFESASGPNGARSDGTIRRLVIDQQGAVWRVTSGTEAPQPTERVGRVPPADLARMRKLAEDGIAHPAVARRDGCNDCPSASILAYGLNGKGKDPLVLVSGGPQAAEPASAACRTVVDWMAAIDKRALRLPRSRPFGLELPIVEGIQDDDTGEIGSGLLELRRGRGERGLGVVLDTNGGVFRFQDRSGEPRANRKVAALSARQLTRIASQAQRLRDAVWQGGGADVRDCPSIRWFQTGQSTPTRVSGECHEGGRLLGSDADAIIAFMYGLDEQVAAVDEPGWPLR